MMRNGTGNISLIAPRYYEREQPRLNFAENEALGLRSVALVFGKS